MSLTNVLRETPQLYVFALLDFSYVQDEVLIQLLWFSFSLHVVFNSHELLSLTLIYDLYNYLFEQQYHTG